MNLFQEFKSDIKYNDKKKTISDFDGYFVCSFRKYNEGSLPIFIQDYSEICKDNLKTFH